MITAGKGASGGYWPLGLCIASGNLYDTVQAAGTFAHGFTWSHHPVGAAVAEATVHVIEREGLVEASRDLGDRGQAWLRSELGDHPNVGEIRGRGLLMAVEFVADRSSKAPFDRTERVAERVAEAAFDRRLTVYPVQFGGRRPGRRRRAARPTVVRLARRAAHDDRPTGRRRALGVAAERVPDQPVSARLGRWERRSVDRERCQFSTWSAAGRQIRRVFARTTMRT